MLPKQAWVNSRDNEILISRGPDMNTIRTAAAALATLSVLATSIVPAFAAMPAAKSFDGGWSVLIVTDKGTCDRAYRYPVSIQNGTVGYAGSASFNVNGKVGAKGDITVTVSRGDKSATGTGTMSDADGAGTWTSKGGECSGTWTAERRS
jgi:lipoprotein-anchoring transpeptidase ErfK/SrfK